MFINSNFRQKYPRLVEYVKKNMQKVLTSNKIVQNMQTYGSLDKSMLHHALLWGTAPELVIIPLDNNFCEVSSALGCYDRNYRNLIFLDERIVKKYQANPDDQSIKFFTASGNSLPVISATILHELCHWGNCKADMASEPEEMGEAFEVATYGMKVILNGVAAFGDDEEAIHGDA